MNTVISMKLIVYLHNLASSALQNLVLNGALELFERPFIPNEV